MAMTTRFDEIYGFCIETNQTLFKEENTNGIVFVSGLHDREVLKVLIFTNA